MNTPQTDVQILTQLNADYLRSDQEGDVARYDAMLAEDFTATLPGSMFLNRAEFLDMISKPRPFTELKCDDVMIRVMGDVALVHASMSFRALDGKVYQGRYTDDYQRRNGKWMCIAANVVAPEV